MLGDLTELVTGYLLPVLCALLLPPHLSLAVPLLGSSLRHLLLGRYRSLERLSHLVNVPDEADKVFF